MEDSADKAGSCHSALHGGPNCDVLVMLVFDLRVTESRLPATALKVPWSPHCAPHFVRRSDVLQSPWPGRASVGVSVSCSAEMQHCRSLGFRLSTPLDWADWITVVAVLPERWDCQVALPRSSSSRSHVVEG